MSRAKLRVILRAFLYGLAIVAILIAGLWIYGHTRQKTAAEMILDDAKLIDGAVDQNAIQNSRPTATPISTPDKLTSRSGEWKLVGSVPGSTLDFASLCR